MSVVFTMMPLTHRQDPSPTRRWALVDKDTSRYTGLTSEYVMDGDVCTSSRLISVGGDTLEMFGMEQAEVDAWIAERSAPSGPALFIRRDDGELEYTDAGREFLHERLVTF